MISQTFHLEVITPCFCAGAEPEKQAEIRAPSIRGQLRWWFRTLGGFKSLASRFESVREQEDFIFGSAAGDKGTAGKLIVRASRLIGVQTMGKREVQSRPGEAYLLWPLAQNITDEHGNRRENRKAFLAPSSDGFTLQITWRGHQDYWSDIDALVSVFGHLGSLGFRSRRAAGAIAFKKNSPTLRLGAFAKPEGMVIKELPLDTNQHPASALAEWLRGWRAYLNPVTQKPYIGSKGYEGGFVVKDHDAGYAVAKGSKQPRTATFRSALGLPIQQRLREANSTVVWNKDFDADEARKNRRYKGEGRFASPVLLRPHRDALNHLRALVIFVDAHKWSACEDGKPEPVFLDGQSHAVSLDLYEAMKCDPDLQGFVPPASC